MFAAGCGVNRSCFFSSKIVRRLSCLFAFPVLLLTLFLIAAWQRCVVAAVGRWGGWVSIYASSGP